MGRTSTYHERQMQKSLIEIPDERDLFERLVGQEIEPTLLEHSVNNFSGRIFDQCDNPSVLEDLAKTVEAWREEGNTIVVASGYSSVSSLNRRDALIDAKFRGAAKHYERLLGDGAWKLLSPSDQDEFTGLIFPEVKLIVVTHDNNEASWVNGAYKILGHQVLINGQVMPIASVVICGGLLMDGNETAAFLDSDVLVDYPDVSSYVVHL